MTAATQLTSASILVARVVGQYEAGRTTFVCVPDNMGCSTLELQVHTCKLLASKRSPITQAARKHQANQRLSFQHSVATPGDGCTDAAARALHVRVLSFSIFMRI